MVTVSVIGLGNRGFEYMNFIKYLYSSLGKTVAVCDINSKVLEEVGKSFSIPDNMRFDSAEAFFEKGTLSDGLIIATQDKSHYEIAKTAIDKGYKYILCEKPVSDNIGECKHLRTLAKENGAQLIVCHVLRYSEYYKKIREIIKSGTIGELVHINHTENVGYFHFAHSFVRGNWKRSDTSTPSILAKCCHDVDLLCWFADSPCEEVESYGGLKYFNREHAPEGATEFCLGGCAVKSSCPYDAEYTYITAPPHKATFVKYNRRTMTGKSGASRKDMYECLKTTGYGRCVFLSDNNVCDHQVVNMKFQNGVTAALTMTAFSLKCKRTGHFIGTKGEIICDDKKMTLCVFGKRPKSIRSGNFLIPGHGEGDMKTVKSFLELIAGTLKDKENVTDIDATVKSHSVAMAAEKSRLSGGIPVKPE